MKKKLMDALTPRGTQAMVALKLGVPATTVNNWANGKNLPDMERWPALEDVLGMNRGELAEAAGIKQPVAAPDIGKILAEVRRQGAEIRQLRAMIERLLAPPDDAARRAPARSKQPPRSTSAKKAPRS